MPTHIAISDERLAQLKALAASENTTVAGAIDLLIADAIAAGKIPDEVPGFSIGRVGDTVSIEAFGAFAKQLDLNQATGFAEQIRAMIAQTKKSNDAFAERFHEMAAGIVKTLGSSQGLLEVTRRGGAVKMVDPQSKAEKTLSPGVARDLARLIDKAAE